MFCLSLTECLATRPYGIRHLVAQVFDILATLTLGAFSDWAFLVCHLGQQPSCLSILYIL